MLNFLKTSGGIEIKHWLKSVNVFNLGHVFFIVKFDHIQHIIMMLILLTMNMYLQSKKVCNHYQLNLQDASVSEGNVFSLSRF